jgi:hypothetical protein
MDFIQKVQELQFSLKLIFQMSVCQLQFFMQLFQFPHNFFHGKYLCHDMNHRKIQNQWEVRDIIKHQIHFLKFIQEHVQMNARKFLYLYHPQIYRELTSSLLQAFCQHPIKTINHHLIFLPQPLDSVILHLM